VNGQRALARGVGRRREADFSPTIFGLPAMSGGPMSALTQRIVGAIDEFERAGIFTQSIYAEKSDGGLAARLLSGDRQLVG
jgi:hypothetical protein